MTDLVRQYGINKLSKKYSAPMDNKCIFYCRLYHTSGHFGQHVRFILHMGTFWKDTFGS